MKKQAIILAALIGAASAQAQSSDKFYVTGAVGTTHLNLDCEGAPSCDTSDTGGKLVGGYKFGNGFSAELGYVNFGKSKLAGGADWISVKVSAITLGGAYALPLNNDWGLNLRLGVAQVKTKADSFITGYGSGTGSRNDTNVYAGIGASYAISPAVKLELGIDSTKAGDADGGGNVRLISLGATFAF